MVLQFILYIWSILSLLLFLMLFYCSKAPKKQRCGETRCMGIAKKKRSSNPIEIDIPEHLKRAIGENCQSYITEIGCIVRQNAPLQVKYWSEIKRDDVDALVRLVRVSTQSIT